MSADQTIAPPARRRDVAGSPRHAATSRPVRVAAIGMGWWSDVLADAIVRSGKLEIATCFTRSADKRGAFAEKYRCRAAATYQEILGDPEIEAVINTTPNDVHLETTRAAAEAGKHVFLDKPIANTVAEARAITEACRKAGVVLALGYQRRRESQFRWIKRQIDEGALGKLVNAEANISRDRLGKVDLSSWRYTAEGMPGGVMLQIGIHYADVLEYLMGPIRAVSGSFVRLVLPGDNPDVASMILEHESGALSTLNASYASASEFYLMNIYGKDATVFYDRHTGMRMLRRGSDSVTQISFASNDTFVEELEEFAAAVRGEATPEVGGEYATRSLAVVRAGVLSAQQGRRVAVAEVLASDGRAARRKTVPARRATGKKR
jgi:predicted dehydrogenase